MMKKKYTIGFLASLMFALAFFAEKVSAQTMTVVDNQTAQQLVDRLTGEGVTVLNPVLTCPGMANGSFSIDGPHNLSIDSGIVLTSGQAMTGPASNGVNGINTGAGPSATSGGGSVDADLAGLITQGLNDLCKLEFDFVPAGDSIKFDYVFASTEYQGFSCSNYNDPFGFFISGPTFPTTHNMAVVPGTDIAITVNSTTSVIPDGGVNNCNDGDCHTCYDIGPGSPFGEYYVDNAGGGTVTYRGFTQVFTAEAQVSACDTYHLKLAIADAQDSGLDSGVFLKAGSLSSTALYVGTYGGGGLEYPFTNTVRGCPPGVIRISRSGGNINEPIDIPLLYLGEATNGEDYQTLPPSITMPAGDSVYNLYVHGIVIDPPEGPKDLIVNIMSPYNCGNGEPVVLASDTIMIYDSIFVNIVNPDTAICIGESVFLVSEGDSFLTYNWTPNNGTIDDPTAYDVTVTPTEPTTYTVKVTLDDITGCPPASAQVFVDVKVTPEVDAGPDRVTCGTAIQLNAATQPNNPDEIFDWQPTTYLNDASIRNPLSTPLATTTYVVKVNPGAEGCDGYDTVTVRLLPDFIDVLNPDTVVCAGTEIHLRVNGDTAFTYNWSPEGDIANPLVPNSILAANNTGWYTLTASHEGCVDMPDSFYVEVQPNPIVNVGLDRIICTYDTVQMYASVMPANYPDYTYLWQPNENLTDSTVQAPVFNGDETVPKIWVKVTTPNGCTGLDTMMIVVNPGDFMTVSTNDTGACPPVNIQLFADGAATYQWSPSWGLDDDQIANPVTTAETTTDYTLIGISDKNCLDTQHVLVQVYPQAVINLPDSVQIWPGESYEIAPGGNALYYTWFPPSGLSATDIANPIAQPEVRTRYFVTALTEHGCEVVDSIDILVNTETALDAPNAFNPGSGDFKIVKRGQAELKYFRVFNRWGNMVFETTDIDEGWDGAFKGKAQPMGVYIFSIEAQTSTGKVFRKDGNVTLVR